MLWFAPLEVATINILHAIQSIQCSAEISILDNGISLKQLLVGSLCNRNIFLKDGKCSKILILTYIFVSSEK
jgi:hypothetical protein